jgi:hypothetical protein
MYWMFNSREDIDYVKRVVSEWLTEKREPLPKRIELSTSVLIRNAPDDLLDFESENVIQSFVNNPLVAVAIYEYVKDASEKNRMLTSMTGALKAMRRENIFTFFNDLLFEDDIDSILHIEMKELFFTELFVRCCFHEDTAELEVREDIMNMVDYLRVIPEYPGSIFCDDSITDRIQNSGENGNFSLDGFYREIMDRYFEVHYEEDTEFIRYISDDPDENYKNKFRQKMFDFISTEIEKHFVAPFRPEFKAEKQRLIDKVFSHLP